MWLNFVKWAKFLTCVKNLIKSHKATKPQSHTNKKKFTLFEGFSESVS